jgi:hypothetical protein
MTCEGPAAEISYVAFISITTAVLITMIGVAVWKQGDGTVRVTNTTSLYRGFLAVTNIVFAYGMFKFPYHVVKDIDKQSQFYSLRQLHFRHSPNTQVPTAGIHFRESFN